MGQNSCKAHGNNDGGYNTVNAQINYPVNCPCEDEEPQDECFDPEICLCTDQGGGCPWSNLETHPPKAPPVPMCLCRGRPCRLPITGVCTCPEIFRDCCGKIRLKYTKNEPEVKQNHFCCTGIPIKTKWEFCNNICFSSDLQRICEDSDDSESEEICPNPLCGQRGRHQKQKCADDVCPCNMGCKMPPGAYCKCRTDFGKCDRKQAKFESKCKQLNKDKWDKDCINIYDIKELMKDNEGGACYPECTNACVKLHVPDECSLKEPEECDPEMCETMSSTSEDPCPSAESCNLKDNYSFPLKDPQKGFIQKLICPHPRKGCNSDY